MMCDIKSILKQTGMDIYYTVVELSLFDECVDVCTKSGILS